MKCKNCYTELSENDTFCSNCGGKIIKERLTLRTLLIEAVEKIFGWDNKFLLTLRTLFFKPEEVILSFINGKRGKYMNPFSIYAFVITIYVFLSTFFQTNIASMMENMKAIFPQSNEAQNMDMQWAFTYQSIISFLNLPFYGIISYLVFRKPYNFGEHLIISVYTVTISTLLSILALIISILTNSWILLIFSTYILLFFSFIIVYQRILRYKPLKLVWKIIKFFIILLIPAILLFLLGLVFAIVTRI